MCALFFLTLPTPQNNRNRCRDVVLKNLDKRFVEQLTVAANSRNLTLEQYIVEAANLASGYHLNNGFCTDKESK